MNTVQYDRSSLRRDLLGLALVGLVVGLVIAGGQLVRGRAARAAGTLTVDGTADGDLVTLAGNTTCDLREAILAAETDAAVGQCDGSSGADGIDFNLTYPAVITLTADLPPISSTLTITGPGVANLVIHGDGSYRQVYVGPAGEVEIYSLTLASGYAAATTWPDRNGGAVHNQGRLILDGVTIVGSSASSNSFCSGGAVYGDTGSVTLIRNGSQIGSALAPNTATGSGGGIFNYAGMTIQDSTVSYNQISAQGGGIMNGDTLTVTNSTIHGNVASSGMGAGIFTTGVGPLTLIDTEVYSNAAGTDGGGLHCTGSTVISGGAVYSNTAGIDGGGIYNASGQLWLANTTVSGNRADWSGGGIYEMGGGHLDNVTISDNVADADMDDTGDGGGIRNNTGVVYFRNTLIAGNEDHSPSTVYTDCLGTLTSYDYNLVGDVTGCTIVGTMTHVITGTDPLLGPLADNGGDTWTHALLAGSPAIDQGSCTDMAGDPVTTDQRGRPRLAPCDIGAYERTFQVYLPLVMRDSP